MTRIVSRTLGGVWVLALVALLSCAGSMPSNIGVENGRLTPCPSSPNCVCSDDPAGEHGIGPLVLAVPPAEAWPEVRQAAEDMPRCKIVEASDDYLHAECRSAIFRFVDDLEIQLRPQENLVAIRSASRVGHSDLGVNRKRVEELREELVARGTVKAAAPSTR